MPEDITHQEQKHTTLEVGPISWWSWRPGIKPRNAFVMGGLITCAALLLAGIGLVTLVLGILDSISPPLLVEGVVANHMLNNLDGRPYLTIYLHTSGFPAQVSATVPGTLLPVIHDGDHIFVNYSPHLHVLYALDDAGQHFVLPGSSLVSDIIGSLALLLLGLALLPYPLLLLLWGWRDLYGQNKENRRSEMKAKVIGLRAAVSTRAMRPGLVPRISHSWYGVALYPADAPAGEQASTFAVSKEMYKSVHEGDLVHIIYSSHLHYVYALEQVSE